MDAVSRTPMWRSITSFAFLSLTAVAACAHRPAAAPMVSQLWEVTNRSACTAAIYVIPTRRGVSQRLADLPAGATQRYRILASPTGRPVFAVPYQDNGGAPYAPLTACPANYESLVQARKVSDSTD